MHIGQKHEKVLVFASTPYIVLTSPLGPSKNPNRVNTVRNRI